MTNPNQSGSEVPESTHIRLGSSDLLVSRVGLGAWPMAGLTSLGVTDDASIATIQRGLACGINTIDTAYSYGIDGRSDRVIASAIAGCRDQVVLASKVGARLDAQGVWTNEAQPEAILRQAREILDRLRVDRVDLMYLHAPDPKVPLAESADALREVVDRGWARWAGVSNVDLNQAREFHSRCPVVAIQTYFNMFQQESVLGLREFCQQQSISLVAYWVLMKGLLAGRMGREHQFDPADRRLKYPVYQGAQWQAAQDVLDHLRAMANSMGCTVAQLVIAWVLAQPGLAVALVGAKRPEQIEETAAAMKIRLESTSLATLDRLSEAFRQRANWTR